MKKLLTTVTLLSCSLFFSYAQSVGDTFISGKLQYKITSVSSDKTVSVKGTDGTLSGHLEIPRTVSYNSVTYKVEEGHYRVAAISTSNHTFSGYEGELLAVGLEGITSEDICLRNIRFFTTDGEEHRFDDIVMQSGTATDIASPRQPSNEEAQDIYDLQGRKMVNGKWLNGKSSKGIYIVNGKKIAF